VNLSPCAFQIVFCLITCTFMPFLPESPRYLANRDRIAEATIALAALRSVAPDGVSVELQEIQYAISVEREEAGTWADAFKDGGISGSTRVLLAFSANFFQQLSGSNLMSSMGAYVFQNSVGMSERQSLLMNGGLQVWYFLSSLVPWFIVDKVGRRRLFILGSVGMGICMTLSAIFEGIGTKSLGYGTAVVLYLFYTFFTLGWQSNVSLSHLHPIHVSRGMLTGVGWQMWIYPSEILPLKLRLRGGALAVVSQWLWTFLVVE
jgi:Na+/melibiose symporter-like transporter